MGSMKTTIDAFQAAGLREKVKIMVGGAPVTQQYADAIGADGYSDSAGNAVALARKLGAV
jgi:5-methyltetrahydrofolate--homocysteine methyltransferase